MSRAYYGTFASRFVREMFSFGRSQLIVIVLAIATLALQVRAGLLRRADWNASVWSTIWPYILYFGAFLLYKFVRVPERLYDEKTNELQTAKATIAALMPKRSQSEQYHYDKARKFLRKFGASFIEPLRYLVSHGQFKYSSMYFPSGLPAGIKPDEMIRIYLACNGEGLVTKDSNPTRGEVSFRIADPMVTALKELLYDPELFSE